MLQGLPLSNELGWWSTHSGSSSSGSLASGTSCAWISYGSTLAYSSDTAIRTSSYDPVWCIGMHDYKSRAWDEMRYDEYEWFHVDEQFHFYFTE